MKLTREQRRAIERESKRWPATLVEVPREEWPASHAHMTLQPRQAWRSRDFLVVVYEAPAPALARLSINRTQHIGERWLDQITWEELQRLKAECGFADAWAVEIYPAHSAVVNVANMRHLWVLPEAPAYAWGAKDRPR